jgi:hypothetical protein
MARWCVTACSLLFISLAGLALGLALWKAWKGFRRWVQRDPLALKKQTLAINVLALLVGTTAIVRLHLQARQQLQPTVPTYPSGVKPDSLESTPDDDDPLKRPTPSDPSSSERSLHDSECQAHSFVSQGSLKPRVAFCHSLTAGMSYYSLANDVDATADEKTN